jgi:hypothetical protein
LKTDKKKQLMENLFTTQLKYKHFQIHHCAWILSWIRQYKYIIQIMPVQTHQCHDSRTSSWTGHFTNTMTVGGKHYEQHHSI